jgi:3-(3-hydroxy-phenyl)propionate hydroxylase
MLSTYNYPRYAHRRAAELDAPGAIKRHPVVVVGAGPVGLAAAIDLAQHGLPVLLLDDDDTVSVGSRGLCYAKRALEVLDRLGCGEPVVAQGRDLECGPHLLPRRRGLQLQPAARTGHRRPGMVNLQQYYLEEYQVARGGELPLIDLRWKNKVTAVTPRRWRHRWRCRRPTATTPCRPTG